MLPCTCVLIYTCDGLWRLLCFSCYNFTISDMLQKSLSNGIFKIAHFNPTKREFRLKKNQLVFEHTIERSMLELPIAVFEIGHS